jgi:hypothetical protein
MRKYLRINRRRMFKMAQKRINVWQLNCLDLTESIFQELERITMKSLRMIGISLGIALLAVTAAHADTTDTQTFSVLINSGTLSGDTYTGSYTWDASVNTQLTSFNFNLPGWVDATTNNGATLADLGAAFAPYSDGTGLELFYAPAPIGNPDAFAFFGGSGFFTYGTTLVVNGEFADDGSGEVTYGAITSTSSATPEPGTFLLLASGLAAGLGAVRRKLKV